MPNTYLVGSGRRRKTGLKITDK